VSGVDHARLRPVPTALPAGQRHIWPFSALAAAFEAAEHHSHARPSPLRGRRVWCLSMAAEISSGIGKPSPVFEQPARRALTGAD
jgi:hypothetical protein